MSLANPPAHANLPTGTVTFVFTDIEGSTALWQAHPGEMPAALAKHDRTLQRSIRAHGGHVVKTTGDGLLAVFTSVSDALAACLWAQRELQRGTKRPNAPHSRRDAAAPLRLRVRMGLHTGEALLRDGDYFGDPLNIAARLTALAAGGQIIVSALTAELLTGRLPPGVELKDLGEHRLKGVGRPHRVLQIVAPGLEQDFPPPPTAEPAAHAVPRPLTSFVGRGRELVDCARLLDGTRLVTLTGLGGTGKTRLALEVAERSRALYHDGVFFVDLVPVAEPDRVASTVAAVLGVGEQPGRSMLSSVCARMEDRHTLIVLDNCEHVLRGAAAFVGGLLASTKRVTVLATSREPLGVAGEQVEPVAPLAVARPDAIGPGEVSDAGRLFLSRASVSARRFSPGDGELRLVEAICSKLEGLPLAIELAAARLKVLSLQDIHDKLSDRFELLRGLTTVERRHQTLRGVIEWSYAQLDPREQKALRHVSVFAGGWSLAAAAHVLSTDEYDAIDQLERLVDKSLVVVDRPGPAHVRYRMLETVRDYALAQLRQAGEVDEARTRHLDYFAAFVRPTLDERGTGKNNDLDTDYDNLMLAHAWCDCVPAATERRLCLALALTRMLRNRAHPRMARTLIGDPLGRPSDAVAEALRGKALIAAGDCAADVGDREAAERLFVAALEVARQANDASLATVSLWKLSGEVAQTRELDRARRYAEEALAIAHACNSPYDVAASHNQLGELCRMEGRFEQAALHYGQEYAVYRDHGVETINPSLNLAMVANERGDHALAYRYLSAAAAETRTRANAYYACWLPQHVAALAAATGDAVFAARMWGAAESIRAATGLTLQRADMEFLEPRIELCRQALGPVNFEDACREGRAVSLADAIREIDAWLARNDGAAASDTAPRRDDR